MLFYFVLKINEIIYEKYLGYVWSFKYIIVVFFFNIERVIRVSWFCKRWLKVFNAVFGG